MLTTDIENLKEIDLRSSNSSCYHIVGVNSGMQMRALMKGANKFIMNELIGE